MGFKLTKKHKEILMYIAVAVVAYFVWNHFMKNKVPSPVVEGLCVAKGDSDENADTCSVLRDSSRCRAERKCSWEEDEDRGEEEDEDRGEDDSSHLSVSMAPLLYAQMAMYNYGLCYHYAKVKQALSGKNEEDSRRDLENDIACCSGTGGDNCISNNLPHVWAQENITTDDTCMEQLSQVGGIIGIGSIKQVEYYTGIINLLDDVGHRLSDLEDHRILINNELTNHIKDVIRGIHTETYGRFNSRTDVGCE